MPAAAELLALERLREFSGAPFDPAGDARHGQRRRSTSACRCGPICRTGSTDYDIAVDLSNFSADKMVFGQQGRGADAAGHRQQPDIYEIKGDVRIGGTPAQVEYRKLTGEPEAEVRLQATLDEAARARLGLDLGTALTGALPMRLNGRVGDDERDAPLQRRGRSDRHEDRQSAARLGQARRAAGARWPSRCVSEKTDFASTTC